MQVYFYDVDEHKRLWVGDMEFIPEKGDTIFADNRKWEVLQREFFLPTVTKSEAEVYIDLKEREED